MEQIRIQRQILKKHKKENHTQQKHRWQVAVCQPPDIASDSVPTPFISLQSSKIHKTLSTLIPSLWSKKTKKYIMNRKQNFQTIAWFYDLFNRGMINLDPPYQRRSVWNQSYKDFFIDTILLNYPAPAVFLYEEIKPDGTTKYNVVDGKQRLTAIFEFLKNEFPVGEKATLNDYRGKFFEELSDEIRVEVYQYTFLVEYLPTANENIINSIFDRINRNVAKLTAQELRHAKYSGEFITSAEDFSISIFNDLHPSFPRIANKSKKQMKDVELVSQLLLLLETGPKGYSSEELDAAYSDRDVEWLEKENVEARYRKVIDKLHQILLKDDENIIVKSRLQNQADFYSLFGAINEDFDKNEILEIDVYYEKISNFIELLNNINQHKSNNDLQDYYQYARVASNRTTARKERIRILKKFIHEN